MQSSMGTLMALPALIWTGISGMVLISPVTDREEPGIIPPRRSGQAVYRSMPGPNIAGMLTSIAIGVEAAR